MHGVPRGTDDIAVMPPVALQLALHAHIKHLQHMRSSGVRDFEAASHASVVDQLSIAAQTLQGDPSTLRAAGSLVEHSITQPHGSRFHRPAHLVCCCEEAKPTTGRLTLP